MTPKRARHFIQFLRTIHARLLIAFVLLVVLPAGAITVNSITLGLKNGRQQAFEQFESVAALKAAWLGIWTQNLQTDLLGLAKERWYRQAAAILMDNPEQSDFQKRHQYILDRFIQVMELTNRYEELFLVSREGYIILSTDPVKVGEYRGLQPYVKQGLEQPGVHVQSLAFSSASEHLNNLIVVHPVKDTEDKVVGVMCGQANFGAVNAIMGQRTGLGDSGETYLVSPNHVLMTIARFPGFTPGMASIHARGVDLALRGKSNIAGLFHDYRGVPVIGVYHWIPGLNLVIAAEQDRSEAFRPIYAATWHNAIVAMLAVLVAGAAALFFTRSISRPVTNLSAVATRIAEGDLKLTAETNRSDEIGSLAQSFNRMTARLRDRIDTERLLADMSRKFISLPISETGPAIEQAIGEIGRALGVDRSHVSHFSMNEKSITSTHGWCHHGVPPRIDKLDGMVIESLPWFAARLRNREIIEIFSVADLPPEASMEKEQWQADQIQSLICVPMVYGESLRGFVGFDAVREKRRWNKEDIRLLQMVGEIIFNAMAKERTETSLRESEQRFRTVVNASQDAMIVFDPTGTITLFNSAAEKIFNSLQIEVIGQPFDHLIPKKYRKLVHQHIQMLVAPNAPLDVVGKTIELYALRHNNQPFPVELSLSEGQLEGDPFVLAVIRDTTERRQAEAKMKSLQNQLRNIIDSMPSVLVGVNTSGEVTQWNREAQNVTGLTAEKAHGRLLGEVFPKLADEMAKVREAIEDRQPKKDQKVDTGSDGTAKFSDITVYPLVSNGVEGAVIRVDDVTERMRIQEMMIQSEKMLSVGGLAAGMAHEINNPLAAIMQSAQVVIQRTSENLPANLVAAQECGVDMAVIEKYMDTRHISTLISSTKDSGVRAAPIVETMLSFSRKSSYSFEQHSLSDILDDTVELASSDYDLKKKHDFRQITIMREYDSKLPTVSCEKTKIQQVILNLLKNAAEAMSEQSENSDDPQIILRLLREGNMARIEVEDNGPGVDEETRKRIFEPFFTTKSVGEGTGLGLSVSYFIIRENHGGNMAVESVPQKGTRFIIDLPILRKYSEEPPVQISL